MPDRIIYREVRDIHASAPAVWQTDQAFKIQCRLLSALLLSPKRMTRFPVWYFTSPDLRWIAERVKQCGGEFTKWMAAKEHRGRWGMIDILVRLSLCWEGPDLTEAEINAMTATVEGYFVAQQRWAKSIEQASRAWSGK